MGTRGHLEPCEEEGGPVMERWTWPYIAQQVIVLGTWCWVLWVIWHEVRGLLEEMGSHEP